MDYTQIVVQLGIGGTMAGGTLYILREYLTRTDSRIDARDKAFMEFVQENNHKMTELVIKSTSSIEASTTAIQAATGAMEKLGERVEAHNNK